MEEADARPSKKARRPGAGSGLTLFALRLAKQLSEDGSSGDNLVFSPLSIYAALALVAAGAGGETLDEFLALLGAASCDELAEFVRGMAESALTDRSVSGGPLVAFACGFWHQETLALRPAYRAPPWSPTRPRRAPPISSRRGSTKGDKQRNWVSKATNKLITSIHPKRSVKPSTALVFANAIYFKGKWSKPFEQEKTKDREFYCLGGSRVHGGTAHRGARRLPYRNSDERTRFSMCFFLPDARDGLPGLVDKMTSSFSSFLRDHLPKRRVKVGEFLLPKTVFVPTLPFLFPVASA
ncbi:serpin-Z2A-like [Panicum miliaceum]|uniref:Serpin-Z2A-like n=1 Tax=Panicum miliaceum TaxID=4540 RepID=A0A3L6SGR0_PANMI|nr:serpin-Z2A-like [Panicum miliaceum]